MNIENQNEPWELKEAEEIPPKPKKQWFLVRALSWILMMLAFFRWSLNPAGRTANDWVFWALLLSFILMNIYRFKNRENN